MKGRCRYRITSAAEARASKPPKQEAKMIAMPNPEVTSTWSQDTLRQCRVKHDKLLFYIFAEKRLKKLIRCQGISWGGFGRKRHLDVWFASFLFGQRALKREVHANIFLAAL